MKTIIGKAIVILSLTLVMLGCASNTRPTIGMCPITGHVSSSFDGQRTAL